MDLTGRKLIWALDLFHATLYLFNLLVVDITLKYDIPKNYEANRGITNQSTIFPVRCLNGKVKDMNWFKHNAKLKADTSWNENISRHVWKKDLGTK